MAAPKDDFGSEDEWESADTPAMKPAGRAPRRDHMVRKLDGDREREGEEMKKGKKKGRN